MGTLGGTDRERPTGGETPAFLTFARSSSPPVDAQFQNAGVPGGWLGGVSPPFAANRTFTLPHRSAGKEEGQAF
jgi:hypothetical protein